MDEDELVEIYELMSSDEDEPASRTSACGTAEEASSPLGNRTTDDPADPSLVTRSVQEIDIPASLVNVKAEEDECNHSAEASDENQEASRPAKIEVIDISEEPTPDKPDHDKTEQPKDSVSEPQLEQQPQTGTKGDEVLIRMVKNFLSRKRWGSAEKAIAGFLEHRLHPSPEQLSKCLASMVEKGDLRREEVNPGLVKYYLAATMEQHSNGAADPIPAKRSRPDRVWREPQEPSVLFASRPSSSQYGVPRRPESAVVRGLSSTSTHSVGSRPLFYGNAPALHPPYPAHPYHEYERGQNWTENRRREDDYCGTTVPKGGLHPTGSPLDIRSHPANHASFDDPYHGSAHLAYSGQASYPPDYYAASREHGHDSWREAGTSALPATQYNAANDRGNEHYPRTSNNYASSTHDILIINDGTLFGLEPLTRCTVDINHLSCQPSTVEEALGHSEFIERYHPDFFLEPRNRIIGDLRILTLLQHTLVMWASRFDLSHPAVKEFLLELLDPRQSLQNNDLAHWYNYRDKLPDQPGRRTEREVLPEDLNLAIRQRLYTCDVSKRTLMENSAADIKFSSSVGQGLRGRDADIWATLWDDAPRIIDTVRRIHVKKMATSDSWRKPMTSSGYEEGDLRPVSSQTRVHYGQANETHHIRPIPASPVHDYNQGNKYAAYQDVHHAHRDYYGAASDSEYEKRYSGERPRAVDRQPPGYSSTPLRPLPPQGRPPLQAASRVGPSYPRRSYVPRAHPPAPSGGNSRSRRLTVVVDDSTATGLEPWTECGVHEDHFDCDVETTTTAMQYSLFLRKHDPDFFQRAENADLGTLPVRTLLQHILLIWASRFDVAQPLVQEFIRRLLGHDPGMTKEANAERAIQLWIDFKDRLPPIRNERCDRDVLPSDLRIALKQRWYRCQVLQRTLEANQYIEFSTSVGSELPASSREGGAWRALWKKMSGIIGFLRKRGAHAKPHGAKSTGPEEDFDDDGNFDDLVLQESIEDDNRSPPSDIDHER